MSYNYEEGEMISSNVLNIDPNEVAAENKYIKAEKGITKIFFDGKGRKTVLRHRPRVRGDAGERT